MIHDLKIEKPYLKRLLSGDKKAEIRLNDRDYQVNDALKFYDEINSPYGKFEYVFFRITHIHSGLGMKNDGCGYVCLSVERIKE